MLFTFEGVEGAGKTTQIRILAERLRGLGLDVVVTREPGDGPLGPQLRAMVLQPPENVVVDSTTELLIMMADRSQHVANVITPALLRGAIVLCDRYADSSAAYQGYGRGIDLSTIDALNHMATQGVTPIRTFLLDLDPSEGLARQSDRNRMEMLALDFHNRVRSGFLRLAALFPERFVIVPAELPVDDIHNRIWATLIAAISAASVPAQS